MKSLVKISQVALLALATVFVIGCDDGDSNNNTTNNTITHNGIDYKAVKSPITGRVWLDRNLGAARVCQAFNDVACYGDYYQWGRNADGHQDSSSAITTTQATNVENVGHMLFIAGHSDWANNGVDDNGAVRTANWIKLDGSSVCPVGFRVPTKDEVTAEFININNRVDAFNSFLKLPAAGARDYTGAMIQVGENGALYTITSSGAQKAYDIYYTINQAGVFNPSYANGINIRCIKAQ